MFRNLFLNKPVKNRQHGDIDPATSNSPALTESSSSSNAESEEILTLQQITKLKHSKSSGRLINRAEIEKQANSGDPDDSFDPYSPSILRRSKSLPLRVCSKLLFPALNRKRSVKFAIPENNEETGSKEYRCIEEDRDLDMSPFKDRELCSLELETISDYRECETTELNVGNGVKNQSSVKYPDTKLNFEDDQFHNNSPNFDVHRDFISGPSRQSNNPIFKPLRDQSVPNTYFEHDTIRDSKDRGQSGSCLNSPVFQLVDEYSSEESNSSTLLNSFGEGDEIQSSLKRLATLCELEVSVEFHTRKDFCSLLNRIGDELAAKYDNIAAKYSSANSKVSQLETISINEAHRKKEDQLEEEKKSVFKIIEKYSQIENDFDLCVYVEKVLTERNQLTGRNRELVGIVEELKKSQKNLHKLRNQNIELYNNRQKENEMVLKNPDYSEGVKLNMTTDTPESNFCSKSIMSSLSKQTSNLYNSNSYLADREQENDLIISTLKSSLEATILERDSLQSHLKQLQILLEEKEKLILEQNTNKSMNRSTQEKGTIQALNCDLDLLQQLLQKSLQELCEARPDDETNRSDQDLKLNAKEEIASKRIKSLERAIESIRSKLSTLNHLNSQIRLKVQQAEDIVRFGFDNCEYLISKDKTQIETLEEMVKVLELNLEQVLQYSILQKGHITHLERVVCEAETIFSQPNELELIQYIVKEITAGYETKERQYEECNQFLRQSFENSIKDREMLMKDQRLLRIENTELHATIENMKEVLSKLKRDQEQLTSSHDAVDRSNQVLLLTLLSLTKDSFDCLTPILRDDAISHFKRLHKWLQEKHIFSESDKFLLDKLCKYIVKVENEVFLEYSSNEDIMIGIISGENEKLKEVDINRHRERKG